MWSHYFLTSFECGLNYYNHKCFEPHLHLYSAWPTCDWMLIQKCNSEALSGAVSAQMLVFPHVYSSMFVSFPLVQLVKVLKFCAKCHSCLLTNHSRPKGRASEGRTWRIFSSLVFNHRASGRKHGVLFRRCNETGGHLADVWEATLPDSEWTAGESQSQRSACYVMEWSGITELPLE